MTEDLLDLTSEEKDLAQKNAFNKLKMILFILVILVSLLSIVISFATIPDNATLTQPSFLSGWKVPYALSLVILLTFPLISLLLSFLAGIIPFRKFSYRQRVLILFLLILLIIESIALYQLASFTY